MSEFADRDDLDAILAKHGPSSLVNTREGWAECRCEARLPVDFDDPTCGYYENEDEIWAGHVAQIVLESNWLRGVRAKELRDAADALEPYRDPRDAVFNGLPFARSWAQNRKRTARLLRDRADRVDAEDGGR